MLFREFHRILNIDMYFKKKNISSDYTKYKMKRMTSDIMSLINKKDVQGLKEYLYDYNDKSTFDLFAYITGSRNARTKEQIYSIIEEYMTDLHEYLHQNSHKIELKVEKTESLKDYLDKHKLNEADDPFADDSEGGDDSASDSGSDDAGGDPFGDSGSDAPKYSGSAQASDTPTEPTDTHEEDPDFKTGRANPADLTLPAQPSGETAINVENVMTNLNSLLLGNNKDFVDMPKFKKAVELICSGKKLNMDDLTFVDTKKVIEKLKTLLSGVDDFTANYIKQKIRQPIAIDYMNKKLDAIQQKQNKEFLSQAL